VRNLDNWIDSYMQYTDNSEPPELFRRWVAISVIASVLRRKCFISWGPLTFFPNLYVVLTSPPGRARKGTAMEQGSGLLSEPSLGIKLAAEAITREALIRELKNSNDTYFNPSTNEMTFHSSLTVYSQELTVFLGYRNAQLLSDLTDWYDCRKKWTYRTKNMGTDIITGVFFNLIGATTPHLIQSHLPLEALGGGLTSRMIFVYARDKGKTVALPLQTPEEEQLRELLYKDLEAISMLGGKYKLSEDFIQGWAVWYETNDGNHPFTDERFSGYFERRPATIMKLSMIANSSRTSDMTITEDDLNTAVTYLKAVEKDMPQALSGVGRQTYAGITSDIMVEITRKGECSYAYLMRMFQHDVTKWDLDKIMDALVKMKFCSYFQNTGAIVYNEDYERKPNENC